MTSANLYRWSGMALLVGATLSVLGSVVSSVIFPTMAFPQSNQMTIFMTLAIVALIGNMLLLAGLPAIAARLAPHDRGLGLLGYALTFFGGLLFTAFGLIPLVVIPWLSQVAPNAANAAPPPQLFITLLVATILFGVGGLLFGIAIVRGGVLPRATGALVLVGAVLNAAAFALNGIASTIVSTAGLVVFCVGLGWIGYVLVQETRTQVAQVRVASQ